TPVLSVITNIGLDHADILGETVEQIATEKAGIIKNGIPVVAGVSGSAEGVIKSVAAERSAPYENVLDTCEVTSEESRLDGATFTMHMPSGTYSGIRSTLPMEHQMTNALLGARCAYRFLEVSGKEVHALSVVQGVEQVRARSGLLGRFEMLSRSPLIIADVAHNGEGIAALVNHVKRHMPTGRLHVCIAMMRDKKTQDVRAVLHAAGAHVIAVSVESQRANSAAELAALLKQPDMQVDTFGNVGHAIDWFQSHGAPDDVLVITGSHLAVADALRHSAAADEIPETRLSQARKQG
ncbi:MAG: cyanophycin synthetase, partial [Rhodothermales bacterium]|nr:cyanophycin synthetase [Rhodothermales bacterium]